MLASWNPVQPSCKGSSDFCSVSYLGLGNKVLELSDVLLEAIILLGCYPPEGVELIPSSLCTVIWIEH